MRLVGHYNIAHVPKTIKVVVLDVSKTEKACDGVFQYDEKTTITRRDVEEIVDQVIVEFPEIQLFNFDLKSPRYPLWFYDMVFFEATKKEPIQYFVSERASDISERIEFPVKSEAFQSIIQEKIECSNFTAETDDAEYEENYKIMLLKLLELEGVDTNIDSEVGHVLAKYNSVQEYLQGRTNTTTYNKSERIDDRPV
ncbi:unnamed protein product [Kluyveromyces dobzhanskii CBS 2104]|uniref:WGS project CCBQ000000000 data, contig 00046 n=1 Tax=Kluyveromyces dobzhanskii CBS 2104 TaxID=1427455 RepID=A0A0A8L7E7_9SACH|nr:unnamed protein product [Kluyveromyces dobzhanskii CBS 2104]